MSDLRTLLHDAADRSPAASPSAVVDGDLHRGHRALRRQRVRSVGARGGLAAGLALGAFAVSTTGGAGTVSPAGPSAAGTSTPSAAPTPTSATTATATLGRLDLVAYTGAQPEGYTVDTIPAGYDLRTSDTLQLTMAPVGSTTAGRGFEGTIAVTLTINAPGDGRSVDVAGRPGVIVAQTGPDAGRVLLVTLDRVQHSEAMPKPGATASDDPVYLSLQVDRDLEITDDQLVELAAGIHVQPDAEVVYG